MRMDFLLRCRWCNFFFFWQKEILIIWSQESYFMRTILLQLNIKQEKMDFLKKYSSKRVTFSPTTIKPYEKVW